MIKYYDSLLSGQGFDNATREIVFVRFYKKPPGIRFMIYMCEM